MSVDDAAGSLQSKLSRQRTGSLSVAMENRVSRRLSISGSPLFSENFRRPSFAVRRPSLLGGSRRKSATGRRPLWFFAADACFSAQRFHAPSSLPSRVKVSRGDGSNGVVAG